jgi:hypothetical protein
VSETLLLVGDAADLAPELARLQARGIVVRRTESAELKRQYGIEGAPLLMVLSPGGEVSYSGGYSQRKGGPLLDVDIIRGLRTDRSEARLPLFGCAVSKELQQLLDPLSIKYSEP